LTEKKQLSALLDDENKNFLEKRAELALHTAERLSRIGAFERNVALPSSLEHECFEAMMYAASGRIRPSERVVKEICEHIRIRPSDRLQMAEEAHAALQNLWENKPDIPLLDATKFFIRCIVEANSEFTHRTEGLDARSACWGGEGMFTTVRALTYPIAWLLGDVDEQLSGSGYSPDQPEWMVAYKRAFASLDMENDIVPVVWRAEAERNEDSDECPERDLVALLYLLPWCDMTNDEGKKMFGYLMSAMVRLMERAGERRGGEAAAGVVALSGLGFFSFAGKRPETRKRYWVEKAVETGHLCSILSPSSGVSSEDVLDTVTKMAVGGRKLHLDGPVENFFSLLRRELDNLSDDADFSATRALVSRHAALFEAMKSCGCDILEFAEKEAGEYAALAGAKASVADDSVSEGAVLL